MTEPTNKCNGMINHYLRANGAHTFQCDEHDTRDGEWLGYANNGYCQGITESEKGES